MSINNLVTKNQIINNLKQIGLQKDDILMLHASCKSVGNIVGGPDKIIEAILEVIGENGTLMMYISWDQSPYNLKQMSTNEQQIILEHLPAFEVGKARAMKSWSILTEYLRTWPNSKQSKHPEASMVAVGKKAEWLTENHPYQYGYGEGSPLEKLCKANGKVLMLGTPLEKMTVLHYAEHITNCSNKKIVKYKLPIIKNNEKEWIDIEEFDTNGAFDWQGEDYFKLIVAEYLSLGKGSSAQIGSASSHLVYSDKIVAFGKKWMEDKFS